MKHKRVTRPKRGAEHAVVAPAPRSMDGLPSPVSSAPPDTNAAADNLRALEARYRALVLATGQITWTARQDSAGGWTGDDRDWRLFTGQDTGAAGIWSRLDAVHPDDRERTLAAWNAAVASGENCEIDCRVRRHDGEYRWLLVRGVPVLLADGSVHEWVGTATDITARKQAEEALRASEAELARDLADSRRLQDISTSLIHEGNLDALYERILDAAIAVMHSDMASVQILHPARDELRLLAWKGFDPASAAFWERVRADSGTSCGAALRTAERIVVPNVETCDFIAGTPDLDYSRLSGIVAMQSTPLLARDGRLVGMISTHWREPHQPAERELRLLDVLARQVADLIERRRAEEASAHLAAIVTSAEDAIASKTLDGIITSWNARAERMFGYSAQEMIGQSVLRIIPTDRHDEEDHILARLRAGERIEHFETVRVTKDGRPLEVALTISPMRDSTGAIIGASKIVRDITERKRLAEAARESEERFRTLADNIPTLAWMARPDGHIVWYNQRWYDYTGTTTETQEGWGWQSVHDPDMLPQVMERWQRSLATGEPFEMVFPLRGADGVFRPFLTRITPLKDDQGRVVRWFGTNTDISQQLAAEEALRAANVRMDEFLHTATHELKTPLTSLQANLQLVERRLQRLPRSSAPGQSAASPREALESAAQIVARTQQQVRRLTRLVNDLVDAARIQAGKLEIRPAPCDLSEIVWEAVTEQCAVRPERTIHLQLAPGVSAPVPISADADRIGQVVTNYLTNALKYSPEDAPVEVTLAVEGDHPRIARLCVRDQGPGIPPKEQPHVWERGHRVPGIKPSGDGVGLGLGLHISREIVERHGGAVGVESVPGQGSTFWFTLPLAAGASNDGRPEVVAQSRRGEL